MRKVMTATEIMEMIPNCYPICYTDYMDEIVPNEKIATTKNVAINKEFSQGRSPGNPTVPGILIIKALAQVGSILILEMDQLEGETAYIDGISRAKFHQKMTPDDVLRLHLEIVKLRDSVSIGKATAYAEGKEVCEHGLTFTAGR